MTFQLANGIDRHLALNHMGHVVLTSHLLPLLKKTAADGSTVRIVNQASNAHESTPSDTKFEPEELTKDLGPMPTYGRSKLAGILYAKYLNRHLTSAHPNILANASHPGVVDTKMSRDDILEPYPFGGYAMKYGMAPFKKDQFEGALSMLFAATMTEKSGEYICPPAIVEEGSKLANDEALGEQLMKLTRETVMEKTRADAEGCPFRDY
jgi:NAD(P)-dependent dehydrogenase (short-subunit alcohol dehydrogenase family)